MDWGSLEGIDRYGVADPFGVAEEGDARSYSLPRVRAYPALT